MPDPISELHYRTPYELLLAVVLSAQCTDVRVNMLTPALFARFPNPQALSRASWEDILPYIASCSYPNAKAKYLEGIGKRLVSDFGGEVPAERSLLTEGARTPEDTEKQLTSRIPREDWSRAHHWLILHGRYVCVARKPKCTTCPFDNWCPKVGLNLKG